jgi:DNA-directed RNA polymerase specialized sigma24 family protein
MWDQFFLTVRARAHLARPEHGRTADDIVTDALSKLGLRMDEVTGKDGMLRYALRTARNLAIAYRKEEKAHAIQRLTMEPAMLDPSFEEIDCAEVAERLASRLDGPDLQLFRCAIEGRASLRALRTALRLSPAGFRSRLFRLRKKIRAMIVGSSAPQFPGAPAETRH